MINFATKMMNTSSSMQNVAFNGIKDLTSDDTFNILTNWCSTASITSL